MATVQVKLDYRSLYTKGTYDSTGSFARVNYIALCSDQIPTDWETKIDGYTSNHTSSASGASVGTNTLYLTPILLKLQKSQSGVWLNAELDTPSAGVKLITVRNLKFNLIKTLYLMIYNQNFPDWEHEDEDSNTYAQIDNTKTVTMDLVYEVRTEPTTSREFLKLTRVDNVRLSSPATIDRVYARDFEDDVWDAAFNQSTRYDDDSIGKLVRFVDTNMTQYAHDIYVEGVGIGNQTSTTSILRCNAIDFNGSLNNAPADRSVAYVYDFTSLLSSSTSGNTNQAIALQLDYLTDSHADSDTLFWSFTPELQIYDPYPTFNQPDGTIHFLYPTDDQYKPAIDTWDKHTVYYRIKQAGAAVTGTVYSTNELAFDTTINAYTLNNSIYRVNPSAINYTSAGQVYHTRNLNSNLDFSNTPYNASVSAYYFHIPTVDFLETTAMSAMGRDKYTIVFYPPKELSATYAIEESIVENPHGPEADTYIVAPSFTRTEGAIIVLHSYINIMHSSRIENYRPTQSDPVLVRDYYTNYIHDIADITLRSDSDADSVAYYDSKLQSYIRNNRHTETLITFPQIYNGNRENTSFRQYLNASTLIAQYPNTYMYVDFLQLYYDFFMLRGVRDTNCFSFYSNHYSKPVIDTAYQLNKDATKKLFETIGDNINLLTNPAVYCTPMDYYASVKDSEDSKKMMDGEIKVADKTVTNEPTYFWCETLKNWCFYNRIVLSEEASLVIVQLMVWNGLNDWIPCSTLIDAHNKYHCSAEEIIAIMNDPAPDDVKKEKVNKYLALLKTYPFDFSKIDHINITRLFKSHEGYKATGGHYNWEKFKKVASCVYDCTIGKLVDITIDFWSLVIDLNLIGVIVNAAMGKNPLTEIKDSACGMFNSIFTAGNMQFVFAKACKELYTELYSMNEHTTNIFSTEFDPYNSCYFATHGIIAKYDNNYSSSDKDTFQTLRKMYLEGHHLKINNYLLYTQMNLPIGVPMVYRLPNGKLFMATEFYYKGRQGGAAKNTSLYSVESNGHLTMELIENCNKMLREQFGKGENKTVEDYLNVIGNTISINDAVNDEIARSVEDARVEKLYNTKDTAIATIRFTANKTKTSSDADSDNINTLIKW